MDLSRRRTKDFETHVVQYASWDEWFRETLDFAARAQVDPNVFLPPHPSVQASLPAPMPTPPWQR